ncbi:MAG TPA: DUF3093 domain-containing protein [Candidatus Lumbricidophila sp.]|nr:DUF3093 domain-containing protein [Candidatus Lumbricidophila sp.]
MAYRERLVPGPFTYISTLLVVPASLLVWAPVSTVAGVVTAVVLYVGSITALLLSSPVISVDGGMFRAGRAQIETSNLGHAEALNTDRSIVARRTELDARAFLMLRGWTPTSVRVPVTDATDPAPYWLVSTRHPEALAAAINQSRAANATA